MFTSTVSNSEHVVSCSLSYFSFAPFCINFPTLPHFNPPSPFLSKRLIYTCQQSQLQSHKSVLFRAPTKAKIAAYTKHPVFRFITGWCWCLWIKIRPCSFPRILHYVRSVSCNKHKTQRISSSIVWKQENWQWVKSDRLHKRVLWVKLAAVSITTWDRLTACCWIWAEIFFPPLFYSMFLLSKFPTWIQSSCHIKMNPE